jgi:hypothetical protein
VLPPPPQTPSLVYRLMLPDRGEAADVKHAKRTRAESYRRGVPVVAPGRALLNPDPSASLDRCKRPRDAGRKPTERGLGKARRCCSARPCCHCRCERELGCPAIVYRRFELSLLPWRNRLAEREDCHRTYCDDPWPGSRHSLRLGEQWIADVPQSRRELPEPASVHGGDLDRKPQRLRTAGGPLPPQEHLRPGAGAKLPRGARNRSAVAFSNQGHPLAKKHRDAASTRTLSPPRLS